MKSWTWVLLILLVILIKWVSWYPGFVERNYTYGFYPVIARVQRFLLGWIPFSLGDIFYSLLILFILYKFFRLIRTIVRRQVNRRYLVGSMQQGIFFFLFLYVSFNFLWGLNYNRMGISPQLGLDVKKYSLAELDTLTTHLQTRLNYFAGKVTPAQRDSFRKKSRVFDETVRAYATAAEKYPFLRYHTPSLKPSLFSYLGNYLGFQGYYNPFSGEAQVNTTIPGFLEPFVTAHEVAHQLGYGKENEANFVAFLACRNDSSQVMNYSMYFDMYNYAINEMRRRDTARSRYFGKQLHPQVREDYATFIKFMWGHRSPVQPVVNWGYGHYLKANNQPGGKETYNEVVAWLVAYYRKFGVEAL